ERYLHPGFRTSDPQAAARVRATLLRGDPQGYAATCHAVGSVDYLDRLRAISVPTLIVAGALDIGAPPAISPAIHAAIAGSTLVVLNEASHLSVAEQPAEFSSLLRDFLVKVDG